MEYKKIIAALTLGLTLCWILLQPLTSFAAEEGVPILRRRGLSVCFFGEEGWEGKFRAAKTEQERLKIQTPGSCTIEDILTFASSIMDWMVAVCGAIALLMFVIGGAWMIFSGGNSSRVERGKDVLTGTTIALIFILGSWVIVQFVVQGLGADERFQLTEIPCGTKENECPANTTCNVEKKRCEDQCTTLHGAQDWSCQVPSNQTGCLAGLCRNGGDVCCPPL